MVEKPNVLVLDEPTNHLDLEAIHALVGALQAFEGTVIFVSHDRWFVSELATRILEVTPGGFGDFPGTYDEYLARCGDDHLDAEAVVLKAKAKEGRGPAPPAASRPRRAQSSGRAEEEAQPPESAPRAPRQGPRRHRGRRGAQARHPASSTPSGLLPAHAQGGDLVGLEREDKELGARRSRPGSRSGRPIEKELASGPAGDSPSASGEDP